ncbi:MAG: FAD-binding oxidoreductase, partial [Gemmatimonadetes bacterium]
LTAFHLARQGADVVLLERGEVAGGATGAAVGVLSPPLRQPYHQTVHEKGRDTARTLWDFALRSIASLADLIETEGATAETDLDLSGGLVLAEPHTLHQVENSYRALEADGFPVRWLDRDQVRERCRGQGFSGGYLIERGGGLDPAATARFLARLATRLGARVFENVDVTGVEQTAGGLVCHVGERRLRCGAVVYATHIDVRRFSSFLGREVVPIRGQGFATEPVGDRRFTGSLTTHWKLNVWLQRGDGRVVVSGWRHDAWDRAYGQADPALDPGLQADLADWFHIAFPDVPLRIRSRWSGVFGWTGDFLPLVGEVPTGVREFVVSGFSGGGLPFAFECGRAVAHMIGHRAPVPGAVLFSPQRFSRRSVG